MHLMPDSLPAVTPPYPLPQHGFPTHTSDSRNRHRARYPRHKITERNATSLHHNPFLPALLNEPPRATYSHTSASGNLFWKKLRMLTIESCLAALVLIASSHSLPLKGNTLKTTTSTTIEPRQSQKVTAQRQQSLVGFGHAHCWKYIQQWITLIV